MTAPREVLIEKWNNFNNVLDSANLTADRITYVWDAEPFSAAFLLCKYTYSAATEWEVSFETSYDNEVTWYKVPEVQAGGGSDAFKATFDNAADLNVYVPVNCAGCSAMRAVFTNPSGNADAGDLIEAKLVLTRGV